MSITERIRRGDPIPAPLAVLLQAATVGQRLGMWWRLRQPRVRVAARVISFGNITAGGAGKTPAVIARAEEELARGKSVAVITRGYGAQSVTEPLVRLPGAPAAPHLLGDEPALIARRLPGVCVVRARDRVAGARAAIAAGCDTLLLDDGYQAVALERDENVLLIDAVQPFGNGCLLPRGILREPLVAMNRATAVVLTRCDQVENLEPLLETLQRHVPGIPLRKTRHAPRAFWKIDTGNWLPLDAFRDREVTALCAIGHPEAFFATLESLGVRIRERIALPDHDPLPESLLRRTGGPLLMTEKDAVRLAAAPENAYALSICLEDLP